ncbi:hypothetical protein RhiirA4_472190 [Rhizophagus irregularis]|uniref:Uncharacterized protein n=1 Tax=Rhizophagus irregularis TaxID=588596 RepID=A0A2I1H4K1_9GLOM|nr:hypothetical protein RhiirA4_472190 [Rhizophagus irregularis]
MAFSSNNKLLAGLIKYSLKGLSEIAMVKTIKEICDQDLISYENLYLKFQLTFKTFGMKDFNNKGSTDRYRNFKKNPIYQLANIAQPKELINSLNAKAEPFTSKGKNR